tara:strand:+ start:251 stop:517 length:267 start_codon:yes stop_codon:yes gene_type:complete
MATYKRKRTPDSLGLETVTAATLNADTTYIGLVEVTPDSGSAFTVSKVGAIYWWLNAADGETQKLYASNRAPVASITDGVDQADIDPD